MTDFHTDSKARNGASHPGMMGDGTEEQNLGQIGDPQARITQAEVTEAFETPIKRGLALRERAEAAQAWISAKAGLARDWTSDKASDVGDLVVEKPAAVLSISAGATLAAGLAIGFLIGRAATSRDVGPLRAWPR